ncbi:MAG: hypothetical protein ACFFCQ_06140 [Promethearchaeota archaeon]
MPEIHEVAIPGVVYRTRLRHTPEGWVVDIVLRGVVETTVNLKTASDAGVKTALTRAIQQVDIGHQVPEPVLLNIAAALAQKLENTEVESVEETTTGATIDSEMGEEISAVEKKLSKISGRLEEIELRLERIEGRLNI